VKCLQSGVKHLQNIEIVLVKTSSDNMVPFGSGIFWRISNDMTRSIEGDGSAIVFPTVGDREL
jgi:hypothetical protein